MSKLSLDALKQRAEAVASDELLNTISGGLENACHGRKGGASDIKWDDRYSTGLGSFQVQSGLGAINFGF
ncbi:hypothetical protein [uncultured Kriegella sp.]|uniref:hypothetical protein n=1 Tax=uncultured Kriegella sp. TaxID=1798910 RepID=UPI0030D8CDE9